MALPQYVKMAGLIGVTLLIGSQAFRHLIWRPALRPASQGLMEQVSSQLHHRILGLSLAAALAVITAAIADLLRIGSEFTGGALLSAETLQLVPVVASTTVGRYLVWRVALAGLFLLLLLLEIHFPRAVPGVMLLSALGLLGSFSLAGHSGASLGTAPWTALTDLIHLAATTLWYGGLCCLLLLPWRELQAGEDEILTLRQVFDRFARMGLLTMALLALTGTMLAVGRLYGLAALVEHRYGETLLVKLLFLLGLLALAGFNHLIVRRRLNGGYAEARKVIRPLRWAVTGEALLGLAVLAWAGLLSTTAPPQAEPFRVTVTVTDGMVAPANLDLPINRPIRMTVVNRGSVPHLWVAPTLPHEMEGHAHGAGMAGVIFYVEPGKAVTQTYLLRQPGRFEIECVPSNAIPNCTPGIINAR